MTAGGCACGGAGAGGRVVPAGAHARIHQEPPAPLPLRAPPRRDGTQGEGGAEVEGQAMMCVGGA